MGMSSLNKSKVKVFFYHSTTPLNVNLLLLIRPWSSDLLYTHQRGTVLQEDQRVGHQEDVQKHLCPAAEPHQHHHVQGGRPRLRQVSMSVWVCSALQPWDEVSFRVFRATFLSSLQECLLYSPVSSVVASCQLSWR